jgi:hypothetical protein
VQHVPQNQFGLDQCLPKMKQRTTLNYSSSESVFHFSPITEPLFRNTLELSKKEKILNVFNFQKEKAQNDQKARWMCRLNTSALSFEKEYWEINAILPANAHMKLYSKG